MHFTFIQPPSYAAKWKRLGLTDEDLQALEQFILAQPQPGDVMSGTGGMRKMRFAPPSWNRGKSGAVRVCYIVFLASAQCYLLTLFAKNEQPNLSASDKAAWRKWITEKRKELSE